jgi:hypothetical protein
VLLLPQPLLLVLGSQLLPLHMPLLLLLLLLVPP